jgi:plastocyanin
MGGEDIPAQWAAVAAPNPAPVCEAYGRVNRSEEGDVAPTRPLRFVSAAALTAVVLALPQIASAANTGVDIAGFAFAPRTVTVHVGDAVTWSNSDARSHTATADDGSFDTGTISKGASKSVTFSTAGTFGYQCSIHPTMTATVVVQAAALPPTDALATMTPAAIASPASLLALIFGAGATLTLRRLRGRGGSEAAP